MVHRTTRVRYKGRTVYVVYHLRAYKKNKAYHELMEYLTTPRPGRINSKYINQLLKKFKHAWVVDHYRSAPRRK